jgi:CDP-paratose 2-epimerase
MHEAIAKIEGLLGKKARVRYDVNPRNGDHIWYISDVSKFKSHYPDWDFEYGMDDILEEMCRAMQDRDS